MNTAERFLLVRLSSLGDLVHSVPVVPALRRSFPGARIDWVADARWAPLMELVEGLDNVIPLDRSARGTLACIRRLRRARYTCAIDIQGRYRSAVLMWLAGAPRRIGRRPEATREPGAAMFYTQRVAPAGKHIVEMNLSLAVAAGAHQPAELEFPFRVPADAASRVRETLARQGIRDYAVISPGGGWGSKCWPPERFGELCAEIWRRHELRAVINISEGEEELARGVTSAAGDAKPAVISTTIPELAALLAAARLVVAGDTGPLHLAAALGTRVVGLFGATDPERNGPLPRGAVVRNAGGEPPDYVRGDYVRRRDYDPAMLSLTVAQVLAAVEQELGVVAR